MTRFLSLASDLALGAAMIAASVALLSVPFIMLATMPY